MKVSLDWLCDHIDLSGKSVSEIDEMLTFSGVEVEGVETVPELVVVAQVTSSEKHPDADKLSVLPGGRRVGDAAADRVRGEELQGG